MSKEIERKWLLNEFPDLKVIDSYQILQGYISIEPEVRIRGKRCTHTLQRSVEVNYRLCIKGNGDLSRTEVEKDLSKEEYLELETMVLGEMLHKKYLKYGLGKYTLEVSLVNHGDFYYAEIEFPSEEEANAFIVPEWFGKEITYDKNYKMKNYYVTWNQERRS